MKLRTEAKAELEKLKRKRARLEAAWEQGKQTTAKYKRMLEEGRHMSIWPFPSSPLSFLLLLPLSILVFIRLAFT